MAATHERSYGTVWGILALFVAIGAFTWTGELRHASYDALALTREGVLRGQLWRLLTYAFLTGSWLDLLFKLLIFYYIAAPLEAVWGSRRFVTLFAVSVVGGGLTGVALDEPLAGGWAPSMTLMLIHGFLFPDSTIYLFLILPVRVKTLAIVSTAVFLVGCIFAGLRGLALFAGLFCGVIYYVAITRTIPWVRRGRRKLREAGGVAQALRRSGEEALIERVRQIMRRHDTGGSVTAEDRAFIEELVRKADPTQQLCSPYSFSPDNTICPPCRQIGLCLRRYLQRVEEEEAKA